MSKPDFFKESDILSNMGSNVKSTSAGPTDRVRFKQMASTYSKNSFIIEVKGVAVSGRVASVWSSMGVLSPVVVHEPLHRLRDVAQQAAQVDLFLGLAEADVGLPAGQRVILDQREREAEVLLDQRTDRLGVSGRHGNLHLERADLARVAEIIVGGSGSVGQL